VISIDAMGGDHGPSVVVPAVARVVKDGVGAHFLLHGDEAALQAAVAKLPALQGRVEIRHTDKVIAADDKPAQAMRRGKGTSMWNALESLRAGEAVACVSAGNTGALVAISKLILRMAAGVERPALVANWPTLTGRTAVLDVGATIACDAQRLVEFAILGAAFHHAVNGSARPTVGILNVGSEEEKGHEEVREAHRMLREMSSLELDYHGFVEGDDIPKGTVDVVVTDGFTGNVALKTGEGLARFFATELREAMTSGPLSMAGALLAQGALKRLRARLEPPGGGPLLGLNGVVVKAHGGGTASSFADAIKIAADLAASDYAAKAAANMERLARALDAPAPVSETEQ